MPQCENEDKTEIGKKRFYVISQFLEYRKYADAEFPTFKKDFLNNEIEGIGPQSYEALEFVYYEKTLCRRRYWPLLSEEIRGVGKTGRNENLFFAKSGEVDHIDRRFILRR